jgi:hypothetical protein
MDAMSSRFLFPPCHKRLYGVFDNGPKESMAGHLLRSPRFETRQNGTRVVRSLRAGGAAVMPVLLRRYTFY